MGWRAFVSNAQVTVEFGTQANVGACNTIQTRLVGDFGVAGAWHNLAFTIDRDVLTPNLTAWIDGLPIGTSAIGDEMDSHLATKVTLGAQQDGATPFNGRMDEFRMLRKALPFDELTLEQENARGNVATLQTSSVQSFVNF